MADLSKTLEEIDEIFDQDRLEETLELLKSLDHSNVQVLWRLARVKWQMHKVAPTKAARDELVRRGFNYARRALEVDESCGPAHYLYGPLLDAVSELHSTRERVARLGECKKHIERSIELSPNDPFARHSMGEFMFQVSELGWFKQKIMETVYVKAPDASYEEAIEHMEIAEQIEPDFFSRNKILIAKCYIALKDYKSARKYLIKAAEVKCKCKDDEKVVNEAKALLAKHK